MLVAPGNAGTARSRGCAMSRSTSEDIEGLVALAAAEQVDLTIVGPEGPLVAGVVDAFAAKGLKCFGPTRLGARLEGSKTFCKEFLQRHRIPTAGYRSFTQANFDPAYVRSDPRRSSSRPAAWPPARASSSPPARGGHPRRAAMFGGQFGAAGSEVVIEDFLEGEEVSFIVMADGTHVLPLATSQDHKRLLDGDLGPNTGGMGAYSPAPIVTPALHERIMREVIHPTIRGLQRMARPTPVSCTPG